MQTATTPPRHRRGLEARHRPRHRPRPRRRGLERRRARPRRGRGQGRRRRDRRAARRAGRRRRAATSPTRPRSRPRSPSLDGALPPVGALVNNAGITSPTRFLEVTDAEWDRIFAVNVRGAYNITRRVAPGLAERGFGRIVFLSSVSAERGGGVFGGVAYSAAKAAQLGFARALARELGPHGVTVNSVAPGLIGTDITGGALEGERKDQLLAGTPGRAHRHGRRRRRPHHLPLPPGVRLHHRRDLRRQRGVTHPLSRITKRSRYRRSEISDRRFVVPPVSDHRGGPVTRSPAHAATDTDRPGALRALRVAATAAVVIIVLQGVTAGEILSRSRVAETLHFGGAFAVHMLHRAHGAGRLPGRAAAPGVVVADRGRGRRLRREFRPGRVRRARGCSRCTCRSRMLLLVGAVVVMAWSYARPRV